MDMRKQVSQLERELKAIDQQIAQLTTARYRTDGALTLARAYIAEEDALPKLKEV